MKGKLLLKAMGKRRAVTPTMDFGRLISGVYYYIELHIFEGASLDLCIPTLLPCRLLRFGSSSYDSLSYLACCFMLRFLSWAQFLLPASKIPIISKTSILHGLSGRVCEMACEQQVIARLHTPC
jgi:hypothetical protein